MTKFVYDGWDCTAEYDGNNTLQASYMTPGLDQNLTIKRSGSRYYYHQDGLGSVRNITDTSENLQNTYDYYAFGSVIGTPTENVTNDYGFTGRRYDSESGLYYYRARQYAPTLGCFVQRDLVLDEIIRDEVEFRNRLDINEFVFTYDAYLYIRSMGRFEARVSRYYVAIIQRITPLYTHVKNNPPNNTDPSGRGKGVIKRAGSALKMWICMKYCKDCLDAADGIRDMLWKLYNKDPTYDEADYMRDAKQAYYDCAAACGDAMAATLAAGVKFSF